MNEWAATASAMTGVIALVGTFVAKWLEQRTKELSVRLDSEQQMREQLLCQVEKLAVKLTEAIEREDGLQRRIVELEMLVHSKNLAMREIELRYEALSENYRELTANYKESEAVKNELLMFLAADHREKRSGTPPAFSRIQPHMVPKKDPRTEK